MKTKLLIAVALFSLTTIAAAAQNGNKTLHDENLRIRQGVASGQLTGKETSRLRMEEANLRKEAIRYKTNDGRIGRRERADLRRDNKRLDRNIRCQKHYRQRRF